MAKQPGFRFKQFVVNHDQCAMKVGTDSIVLGSWLHDVCADTILDIGCGSGLLALMMAQHNPKAKCIHGVDIDGAAVKQAQDNIADSPWPSLITVSQQDIQHLSIGPSYQLIVSNPPYFTPGIEIDSHRATARYTSNLDHAQLLAAVVKHLTTDGVFACVLPDSALGEFIKAAENVELFVRKQLLIVTKEGQPWSRVCLQFSRRKGDCKTDNLLVYKTNLQYSEGFKSLCKDFYLNF